MGRIYIDTDELRGLARIMRSDTGALGDINVDLTRAWARTSPSPVELAGIGARSAAVQARIATLGASLHAQAADLDIEARGREIDEGDGIARIIDGFLGQGGWALVAGAGGWGKFLMLADHGAHRATQVSTTGPSAARKADQRKNWDLLKNLRAGSPPPWVSSINARLCSPAAPKGAVPAYRGGGHITGPDGRSYPLVYPEIMEGGRSYNADYSHLKHTGIGTLNGRDPGWKRALPPISRVVARPLSDELRGVMGLLALLGTPMGPGSVPARTYRHLRISPTGVPILDIDSADHPKGVSQISGPPPKDRGQAAVDGLGRLGAAGEAVSQEDPASKYHITFEEHPDGRRRAMLRVYELSSNGGDYVITPSYVSLDDAGKPIKSRIYFRGGTINPVDPGWYIDQHRPAR